MITFIYALVDPRTREVRYIGKADDPETRLLGHISKAKHYDHHCATWIRSLLSKGLKPVLEIVDEVSVDQWQAAEAAYIEFYRGEGCDLVNGSPGGEGAGSGEDHPGFGKHLPDETKRKMSAANKGKDRLTAEQRAKLSAKLRTLTGERNSRWGKKHSAETIKRIRDSQKGERAHWFGKKLSDETRAKLSAALSGAKHPMFGKSPSAETRAKLSALNKGKKPSPETRAKISEAQSKRRELERKQKAIEQLELAI